MKPFSRKALERVTGRSGELVSLGAAHDGAVIVRTLEAIVNAASVGPISRGGGSLTALDPTTNREQPQLRVASRGG